MLRWTQAGAVAAPTTVQIRVQRRFDGRVPVGVQAPSRGLDPRELVDNILWFTAGSRGPRTRPCDTLVLTGAGLATRGDLPAAVLIGRAEGIRRVVMHVDIDDLEAVAEAELGASADALALRVGAGPERLRALAAIRRAAARGQEVRASLLLEEADLDAIPALGLEVVAAGARGVQLSYPFPGGPPPPPVPAAAAAAEALLDALPAEVSASIKGLPACVLRPTSAARASWRTPNRWYVDAHHQRDKAVLFLPEVVRFAKADLCRFCALDSRCDGYFDGAGQMPGLPALRPAP
ncbi:MAG: hypothetical protein JNM72_17465 [Deltaproteobacteria bacterium]|jgi:hypothetical protein|nr:hypothetical protein [Deltaproteobacteria bacterium]